MEAKDHLPIIYETYSGLGLFEFGGSSPFFRAKPVRSIQVRYSPELVRNFDTLLGSQYSISLVH